MTDVFSKEKRSEVMGRIRSKDTKPEITVRRYLFSKGLRFRIHIKDLPGKPDIGLPKYKTVIFIHGCFWHGHKNKKCKNSKIPKSNSEFWKEKISYNRRRHSTNLKVLKNSGWNVFVIWECELNQKRRDSTLLGLLNKIILKI